MYIYTFNGGEKRIGGIKVDGWDPIGQIAFEFHGCIFHGHPKCFSGNS